MAADGRRTKRPLALVALAASLVAAVPAAAAGFDDQDTATSTFSAAPDWVGPQAGSTVIAKATGYVAGKVKQGGTYYVYANVTDSGNPPSGVATAKANASSTTSVMSNTALVTGSYSVGGMTYNYRSTLLTADALSEGIRSYSIASTDFAGNSRNQTGFTVTVDNTPPSAAVIWTANRTGGVPGQAESGDTITFTYSEQIDPQSILAGWTGTSINVTVQLIDGGCLVIIGCKRDLVRIFNAGNSVQLALGELQLPDDGYNTGVLGAATAVFNATMVQSGSGSAVITITLGTITAGSAQRGGSGTTTWTPSTAAYDGAGNLAVSTTANHPASLAF